MIACRPALPPPRLGLRLGGRPRELSDEAKRIAVAAEAIYQEGKLNVCEIARHLDISKSTPYSFLRHQGEDIALIEKPNFMINPIARIGRLHSHVSCLFERGHTSNSGELSPGSCRWCLESGHPQIYVAGALS